MSFIREATIAIRATLVLFVITAVIYPFLMLSIAQIFPDQANGSLIDKQGNPVTSSSQAVGSALIGQNFTSDKYFWGRPSTTNYSSFSDKEKDPKNLGQTTGVSGASNFAPSNPDLIKRVKDTVESLKKAGITPTADLVYTSGSSLDPHITPAAAAVQIERVSKVRKLERDRIQTLIDKSTDRRFLGLFGEDGVNVLRLNIALDNLS
jgi:potassium-transporting ATPase KdpC subunit